MEESYRGCYNDCVVPVENVKDEPECGFDFHIGLDGKFKMHIEGNNKTETLGLLSYMSEIMKTMISMNDA